MMARAYFAAFIHAFITPFISLLRLYIVTRRWWIHNIIITVAKKKPMLGMRISRLLTSMTPRSLEKKHFARTRPRGRRMLRIAVFRHAYICAALTFLEMLLFRRSPPAADHEKVRQKGYLKRKLYFWYGSFSYKQTWWWWMILSLLRYFHDYMLGCHEGYWFDRGRICYVSILAYIFHLVGRRLSGTTGRCRRFYYLLLRLAISARRLHGTAFLVNKHLLHTATPLHRSVRFCLSGLHVMPHAPQARRTSFRCRRHCHWAGFYAIVDITLYWRLPFWCIYYFTLDIQTRSLTISDALSAWRYFAFSPCALPRSLTATMARCHALSFTPSVIAAIRLLFDLLGIFSAAD